MAGHSKWATTKRQKAVTDAKRGAIFTKIGNQIAIAARKGTDPEMNPALAAVIEAAKAANMPRANIEKAIARIEDKNAAQLEEVVYEAYGQGGAAIIIEAATNNRNRTLPEIKTALTKNGGRLADPGSVMFQFEQKGVIVIDDKTEDTIMLALEAGAEDAVEEAGNMIIYTTAKDLMPVRAELLAAGVKIRSAELEYIAKVEVDLNSEDQAKILKLLDVIDELDDIVNVHTNARLD